jgi:hypothetical protein
MVVTLRGTQTPAWLMENPDAWTVSQGSPDTALRRGDRVTIISEDGNTIYDSAVVRQAEGGKVWLSKPARIVDLEPGALWSDGHGEVVPVQTGYAFRNIATGVTDSHIFPTVEGAKAAYSRTRPQQVA